MVITIIVLLILAGITINSLVTNDSALNKATQAKEENAHSTVKDQISLELINYKLAKGTEGTKGTSIEYLANNGYFKEDYNEEATIYVIDYSKINGINLGKGTSKETGDVYVAEVQSDTDDNWVLRYYEPSSDYIDLLVFNSNGMVINDQNDAEVAEEPKNASEEPDEMYTLLDAKEEREEKGTYTHGDTEDDPLYIYSVEDLVEFSQNYSEYQNKCITLANTIDFQKDESYKDATRTDFGDANNDGTEKANLKEEMTTETGFKPIENFTGTFNGLYNGKKHEIRNILIDARTAYVGLFAQCTNTTIKNIGLTGSITNQGGPTAAFIANANNITIENCYNKSSVTASTEPASFISMGMNKITLKNSYNEGNIVPTNDTQPTGGLIAMCSNSELTVDNCYNTSNIEMGGNVGGIVGIYSGTNLKVSNSYNTGNITSAKEPSAGIIGMCTNLTGTLEINKCYNTGKIKTSTQTAGIITISSPLTGNCNIQNCYNTGNIIGNEKTCGIAQDFNNNKTQVNYNNCYNTGKIESNDVAVGIAYNGNLNNCYNIGEITGKESKPITYSGSATECYYSKDETDEVKGTEYLSEEDIKKKINKI